MLSSPYPFAPFLLSYFDIHRLSFVFRSLFFAWRGRQLCRRGSILWRQFTRARNLRRRNHKELDRSLRLSAKRGNYMYFRGFAAVDVLLPNRLYERRSQRPKAWWPVLTETYNIKTRPSCTSQIAQTSYEILFVKLVRSVPFIIPSKSIV